MSQGFHENDFQENLSKKSTVSFKYNNFTDMDKINHDNDTVSFSMIVDKKLSSSSPSNTSSSSGTSNRMNNKLNKNELNNNKPKPIPIVNPKSKSKKYKLKQNKTKHTDRIHNNKHNTKTKHTDRTYNNKPMAYSAPSNLSVLNSMNDSDDSDDESYDSFFSNTSDYEDFEETVEKMILAETPPDPFITIQTRNRLRWVDDNNAPKCTICNENFRLFLRRHHCRLCGGVFCGNCADNWETIPESITHIPSSSGLKSDIDRTIPLRLCDKCHEKIVLVKKLEILLKSAQSIEMDIFTFRSIGDQKSEINDFIDEIPSIEDMNSSDLITFTQQFMDGKLWKQLANFYLSKFREIQYKLSYQEYTEWEKNALWTNYKYLKHHDLWMVHTIRAFADDIDRLNAVINYYFSSDNSNTNNTNEDPIGLSDQIKDRQACWQRMCTRLCRPVISWESALLLLDVVCSGSSSGSSSGAGKNINEILTNEIVKAFDKCSDEILEAILPCITDRLIHDELNEILTDFIIKRCSKSIRISNHVYWAFTIVKAEHTKRCDYLISRLFREIPTDIYDSIMKINNFVRTVEDNYQGDVNLEVPIKNLDSIGICVSPTHPELGEQIVTPTISPGEKSATRPVPIVLIDPSSPTLTNNTTNNNSKNVELYKREDLRTDMTVMSIIRLMHEIVKESIDIDLHVVTYNVQPIDKNSGFIAAVNDCDTLYNIEENMKISISNYIRRNNPDTPTKELSERFIRSCAFYSVVTFLLGIGDRHLDNIMLTKRGELFHIDYGFILGKDPKPIKSPYMRITEGMLDAIGGYHSEEYGQFKELCYEIYDVLRRHVNTFVALLSLLPKHNTGGTWTNPTISDNRVLREIVKRFAPGENYEQAKTILHTKIEKSTDITSRGKYHVVDFFHRHNKEGTLQNALSYTVGTTYKGTKSLMSGVWNYVSKTLT